MPVNQGPKASIRYIPAATAKPDQKLRDRPRQNRAATMAKHSTARVRLNVALAQKPEADRKAAHAKATLAVAAIKLMSVNWNANGLLMVTLDSMTEQTDPTRTTDPAPIRSSVSFK